MGRFADVLQEWSGDVSVQNEAVSLTRGIPSAVAWMIEPFVTGIPKESLKFAMEATRRGVLGRKGK
jgi:hypothetical protein